jgi:hypothetical protein
VHDTSRYIAGEGPLTYRRVLREAWGMFRRHYLRVALVALALFVPPQVLAHALEGARGSLEGRPELIEGLGYLIGPLLATLFRLFGPVVYAGYLDEAVGHEYFKGHHISFRIVLRTLPWGRLLVADLIVVVGTVAGLALFVLPGLAWMTLVGLVGPVIVQERAGLADSFRRTIDLCRRAWTMVFVLVVVTIAVEMAVHEAVHLAFHDAPTWASVTSSWLVSAVIGGIVGLVEVALATELMARRPREPAAPA